MKNFWKQIEKTLIRHSLKTSFLIILALGFWLRIYGLNWDQGQHLHPDERFLTMVAIDLEFPQTLREYLDPNRSPFSPYNQGYNFFVYGTFPLFLTKTISSILKLGRYHQIHLVGRFLSALFDLGTLVLIFLIAKRVFPKEKLVPPLASFLYGISVLPIQLSHFFGVDTFLNFFLVLSFYCLVSLIKKPNYKTAIFVGVTFGFALACKVSGAIFAPIIFLALAICFWRSKNFLSPPILGLLILTGGYFAFRITQPYAFAGSHLLNPQPSPQFIENLKILRSYNNPNSWFPPAVQWIKTKPYLSPFSNLVFWGLGVPLGGLAVLGTVYLGLKSIKLKKIDLTTLILAWVLLLFLFQGQEYVKTMRYFLPLYPFLVLNGAILLSKTKRQIIFVIVGLSLIWPLSFVSIYSRPHPRVTASNWIYQNIPAGKTLAVEHWDDALPLPLGQKEPSIYHQVSLPLYDPDTKEKWEKIKNLLEKTDYLILSSNRLWGSISKVPEKYPVTAEYYKKLFGDNLGFVKIAEFTSYPTLGPFQIRDDQAEEAFTVYDHPKVMIFKKQEEITFPNI